MPAADRAPGLPAGGAHELMAASHTGYRDLRIVQDLSPAVRMAVPPGEDRVVPGNRARVQGDHHHQLQGLKVYRRGVTVVLVFVENMPGSRVG